MSEFVLPDTVAFQLQGLHQTVQLVDGSGKKLGTFLPAIDRNEYELVGLEPTAAELREAEQSSEWFTTDEVLRHLETLK